MEYNGRQTAGCFKVNCAEGEIRVTFRDSTYSCKEDGEIVKVKSNLEIKCPDIARFCSL